MTTPAPQPKPFLLRSWHGFIGDPPLDHRGRRTRIIIVHGEILSFWSRISGLPPEVHRQVAQSLNYAKAQRPELRTEQLILFPIVFFGLAVLLSGFSALALPIRWAISCLGVTFPPEPLMVILVVMPLAYGSTLVFRRRIAPVVVPECLRHGYCPSCAYALTDLPVENDGCIVCSECGAAWRIPPPDTTHLRFRTKAYPSDSQAHPRSQSRRQTPLS